MTERVGRVIIPAKANPWPHEERVAKILAKNGHVVEFIPEASSKTPDIYLDGVIFEIKSPMTDDPKKVMRNVKRALLKSQNVIIDSSRIKRIKDSVIQSYLKNRCSNLPFLKRLIFINKGSDVIDIYKKN